MYIDDQHLLRPSDIEDIIESKPTPNFTDKIIEPIYIVIHYTASMYFSETVRWLQNTKARASAHLVIGRSAETAQMVPFNKKAWHAGQSEYKGIRYLNGCSIGIELINAGRLTWKSSGIWVDWCGNKVPSRSVYVDVEGQGWHNFPEPQIKKTVDICRRLVGHYQIRDILGHNDIAPGRKIDPGNAWPMVAFKKQVFR